MRTAAPSGASWADYVRTGGPSYVDRNTGFLAGPWAECISWGVRFEHTSDWNSMPEYSGQDGPVGGVLSAFEASVQGRPDGGELLEAANKLEEASHAAEERGMPLPGMQQGVVDGQPIPSAPSYGQSFQPAYGQQAPHGQPYGQQKPYGQDHAYGQPPMYGQQAMPGQPPMHGQPPMYGQEPGYGQQPGYGYDSQDPYQQPYGTGNPTLLQSHQQQQHQGGMGTGAKMALGVAGGVAAGAGAMYVASHMDEVGEAFGDAGQWVAGAAEDVGEFVGDVADDVF